LPTTHFDTFAFKNDWICASVIVPEFVNTASLMMFPGANPVSDVFTIPVCAMSLVERARLVDAATDVDAVAASSGTTVPIATARTATKTVKNRGRRSAFRVRATRRDM
jgi:hypothetical protein